MEMTMANRTKAPPKRILLATDLSARCDRALDRASALAAAWQAELIAVHALEQTDDFYAAELERRLPAWRRLPDAARIVEDQLRRDLAATALKVTAIAERGEPTDLILEVAAGRDCGLIVTGIARDETLGRFGLGATVDRLLRGSRVPVLVVKQRVRSPYGKILVATDLSEPSLCALQVATALFPDRAMTIFHAHDIPLAGLAIDLDQHQEAYRKIAAGDYAAFLARAGVPEGRRGDFELVVEHGHPGQLIRQYVRDRGIDLVVLGTHGHGVLLDLLLGSTARDIMSSLPCDALVVREPHAVAEAASPS